MSEDNVDVITDKEARYDEMLLSILQNEGKIQPFIDNIFRFLYRRTDFYLVQENVEQPYGFPDGVSEQIVRKAFQKYDKFSKEKLKEKLLGTNENVQTIKKETTQKIKSNIPNKEKEEESKQIEKIKEEFSNNSINNDVSKKEKLKKEQEIFQGNAASYNGAIRDNYSWTQSIKDIDVQVKIDSKIKSSKNVKVKIEKEALQLDVIENGTWKSIIKDKLAWKIKPDESTWTLLPGDHIHINLEKIEERWWENLLISEEKLEVRNMNPEKPMEDLDQESQTKLKQMMFDEHQKKMGLPTSEQNKTNDILRKAWDCEGSPFKGQPFDPSLVMTNNPNNTNTSI